MHPEAFEQLDEELLDKIKKMFIAGSSVEEMLNAIEPSEPNARYSDFI